MKTAIEQGVKGGIDQSTMAEMIRRVVEAIREHGGTVDPSVFERLDALEAQVAVNGMRLDRHRIRLRWLERLVHLLHGWRPNPNL